MGYSCIGGLVCWILVVFCWCVVLVLLVRLVVVFVSFGWFLVRWFFGFGFSFG